MNEITEESVDDAALDWFLQMQEPEIGGEKRENFEYWLSQSKQHQEAYQKLQDLSFDFDLLSISTQGQALRHASHPHKRRGWLFSIAAASVLLAICSFLFVNQYPDITQLSTRKGEILDHTLSDGSILSITPRSQLNIQFSNNQRLVELKQGHVFFNVKQNYEQPFVVKSDTFDVQVTGTIFSVKKFNDNWIVNVAEGAVDIIKKDSVDQNNKQLSLTAGQEIKLNSSSPLGEPILTSINEYENWKKGILIYNNMPFAEIIEDLKRYHHKNIAVAHRDIGETRLSLTVNILAMEQLPELIADILPVTVLRDQYNNIVFTRKSHSQ